MGGGGSLGGLGRLGMSREILRSEGFPAEKPFKMSPRKEAISAETSAC